MSAGTEGDRTPPRKHRSYVGVCLALGSGLGVATGALFGTAGLLVGLFVGAALGLLTGAVVDQQHVTGSRRPRTRE